MKKLDSKSARADGVRRALATRVAAGYLGVSASLLRKLRLRGPEDPGDAGPAFIKLGRNLIVYEIAALDAWLDAKAAKTRQTQRAA